MSPGFSPTVITLVEAGPGAPFDWVMKQPLTYEDDSGTSYEVPASEAVPFKTDLASVPRVLTWLIPRYGLYTKAAVLHDYLCDEDGTDRFEADSIFGATMKELGVPGLRRLLMVGAVTWPTMFGKMLGHLTLSITITVASIAALFYFVSPISRWGWLWGATAIVGTVFLVVAPTTSLIITRGRWWGQVARCVFYSLFPGLLFLGVAIPLFLIVGAFTFLESPLKALENLWRYLAMLVIVKVAILRSQPIIQGREVRPSDPASPPAVPSFPQTSRYAPGSSLLQSRRARRLAQLLSS